MRSREIPLVIGWLGSCVAVACTPPATRESVVEKRSALDFPQCSDTPIAVATGFAHTCALRADNSVQCWGANNVGQLGDGSTTDSLSPVVVTGLASVRAISAGAYHTCALLFDGTVRCWGLNGTGQLGTDLLLSVSPTPVTVVGLTGATAITAGGHVGPGVAHTCALLADGTVRCWGSGLYGQLGDGTNTFSSLPVAVSALSGATAVVAGQLHTCAVVAGGAVHCWGLNNVGQLGDGLTSDSPIPVAVAGLSGATAVALGHLHTCARLSDGTVRCWGNGTMGNLGDGAGTSSPLPVAVTGIGDAVAVAAGTNYACARRAGGTVACWGSNASNELGNGVSGGFRRTPQPVVGVAGAIDIASQTIHSCALLGTGSIRCWGDNSSGQLGNQTTTASATPVEVVTAPLLCRPLPAGTDVSAELLGGLNTVGGVALVFHEVAAAGEVAIVGSETGPPPPGSYTLVPAGGPTRYWDVSTSATFTPPVTFCVRYDQAWVSGSEPLLRLMHDDGAGFVNITTVLDTDADIICGGGGALPTFPLLAEGRACDGAGECASGFCVDGVCCNNTCGDGFAGDCLACAVAAGAAQDGTCTVVTGGTPCSDDGNKCTLDRCDGESGDCQHPPGNENAVCRDAVGVCDQAELCTGNSATCPADTAFPECAPAPVPQMSACTPPACTDVDAGGGVELTFRGGVTLPGDVGVIETIATAPPPTGYQIVGLGPFYWDINTTAGYTPPITVCIDYAPLLLPGVDEAGLRLWHYEGSNWVGITSDLCMSNQVCPDAFPCMSPCPDPATICGSTNSLSPFAIFQAIDTIGPAFGAAPGVVAYATSTSGATVTYALPTAVDAVDGQRPVTCSPASGSLFPPGKTTVDCTAADTIGNSSSASFVVWVQYQAPADGNFFLRPIRPDGSSVFRIGRPVPVRFRLAGASAGITNLTAKLIVSKISDAVRGTVEDDSDETVDDTDMTFKYRPLLRLYAYRWKTSDASRGTYRLRAELGDEVVHQIEVSLKARR